MATKELPTVTPVLDHWKAGLAAFVAAPDVENATAVYLELHTEDAVLMFPNMPAIRGRESIERFIREFSRNYRFEFLEWETDELTVRYDLAVHRFHGVAVLIPRGGGAAVHRDSKYLDVLRRSGDGQWRVAIHMFNTNQ
ncbi:MAG: DUF4440 domain-containing protein [Candidatus Latescibacterota bacterium]